MQIPSMCMCRAMGPIPSHDMGLQRQSLVAAGVLLGRQQVESSPVLEAAAARADAQIQAAMPPQPNMLLQLQGWEVTASILGVVGNWR